MINKNDLLAYSAVRGLNDCYNQIDKEMMRTIIKTNLQNGYYKKISIDNYNAIQCYVDGTKTIEQIIQIIENDIVNKLKKDNDVCWDSFLCSIGRSYVFDIFFRIREYLNDKDYWKILGFCYTTGSLANMNNEVILELFKSERPNKEFVMNESERKYFNSLPNKVTIYRGCSVEEIQSNQFRFSWTLNREVAIFFSDKYHGNKGVRCDVVSKVVEKKMLTAYFNDRSEEEVLLLS